MEELDQSSLHPQIKHPETDMSRPGIEPSLGQAGPLSKSWIARYYLNIRDLYMMWHMIHGLHCEHKLECRITRIPE
jgi:hypothetical protein